MARRLSPHSRIFPSLAALALGAGVLPAYATAAQPQLQPEVVAVSQVKQESEVASASSPVPFTCEPKLYQSANPGVRLYVYDPVSNSYSTVGSVTGPGTTNGMGYNTADNFIYGNANGNLMRIDATGTYTDVGALIYNGNRLGSYNSGDFWGPDRLLIGKTSNNAWLSVDVSDPTNPEISDFPLTGDTWGPVAGDFAVVGNTAYALSPNSASPMILSVVNLSTQVVVNKDTSGATAGSNEGTGAAYADALGNVYFHRNSGSVYRILAEDLDDPNPLVTSMGPAPTAPGGGVLTPSNDGASCPDAASAFSATIASESSSSITDTSAAVTADVNPNGVSTTAVICYGTSSATSGGALQGCTSTASPTNADDTNPLTGTSRVSLNPVTISGLSPRTTYYWQVVTTSSATTTYGSVASFTTTGAPVVTTQPASSVTTTSATVNGIVDPGGLSTTVEFCVGMAADLTGCAPEPASQSPLAAGTSDQVVSADLTGLTPGMTYYVRVQATNTVSSATGSIRSFTTPAPPQVTIGAASGVTSSDARLNATVNPQGSATTVSFCYGTAADFTGCTSVPAVESPLIAVSENLAATADVSGLAPATTYFVRASATNVDGTTQSTDDSFTTDPTPLVLTTTTGSLTPGVVGDPYSKTLSAAGGIAPYSWAVASGALPAGLALNATTGEVSGTPTTAGNFSFTVQVTDDNPQTDTKTFTMSVVARPTATAPSVTSLGTTTVTLTGGVNPGNLVTNVNFCLGTAVDLSNCVLVAADQSPLAAATSSSTVSASVSGLTPATTYYARIQAANSAGGGNSPVISFTTTSAPTATTGDATFRDKAGDAIFNATVDAMGAETSVSFCWGTTPTLVGCTPVTASQSPVLDDSGTTNVSQTVSGLTLGATYFFNVTATNVAGTTVGSTVEFTMPTLAAPTPAITSVSPNSGDAVGGESITITGTNFSTAGIGVKVWIGDAEATVTNTTSTAITVTTPPGTAGAVDVVVSNNDGQAVREANGFTYTSAIYSVTYSGNGATSGSVPVDSTAYTYGMKATISGANTMARGGSEFLGWNTAADGTGSTVFVGASVPITGDVTLYAQWRVAIGISPASIAFGSQDVGAGPTSSQSVTVANTGSSAVSINSGGVTLTGPEAADFTIDGGTCAPSGIIAAGGSCTVLVVFDPSTQGNLSATISVATSLGLLTTSLNGIGTSPTPTPTPTPVVLAGPPRDVLAVAGDGSASVTWVAPLLVGSFPVTDYRFEAQPGGASCLVPVSQNSCVISGLTNGVTYVVTGRALTGAGWGAASDPGAVVTPSPTPGPSPEPLPKPDPVPGPVPPGSVQVTIDGEIDPDAVGIPESDGTVEVVSNGYIVDASAVDSDGRVRPLGDDNQLQPVVGQRVAVSGDGFHPSTYAAVYVHEPEDPQKPDVDTAVIIGAVLVDDSGTFTGSWVLPDQIVGGEYVLQVVGTTTRLEALSANLGMTVLGSQERSIHITGERQVTRALARRVYVDGVTRNLDGERVQARVKLQGETRYAPGSQRTVRDGGFTWQRRTKKKVYVFFETIGSDIERVRSNRIVLVQVKG